MGIEEGFYLKRGEINTNVFYVYRDGNNWKEKSRTGNVFDIDEDALKSWDNNRVRVDPVQYLKMAKLNSAFVESKLEELSKDNE